MKPRDAKKSKKAEYEEEYAASKKNGETFFPETIARDAIMALFVVGTIITLAVLFPAQTEPPADPTSTTYNPRPEWYFLFFFQFLKLFPGFLEPVAAVIIPTVAILILVLIPFLDRNPERRYSSRKLIIGTGIITIALLGTMGVIGGISAPSRPAGEESPMVQAGRKVYKEINCGYCHSISGVGGAVGPDLSNIGGTRTEEQLTTYLKNPDAMVDATLHPKLLYTDEELHALVTYLLTLGAPVEYSDEAPVLFAKYCSSCHAINGRGGRVGPDLSTIGDRRSLNFLESFTVNPSSVFGGSTMPAYEDTLTKEQIANLAAYMANQKGTTPPPPPPPPEITALPLIPHDINGRGNCLACHETGLGDATVVPSDHTGRTNDMCLGCHKPGESGESDD
ncbi:c-type cytochrome [Chloroflexota bacterium]